MHLGKCLCVESCSQNIRVSWRPFCLCTKINCEFVNVNHNKSYGTWMDLQKKSKKTMGYSLENRITEVRQG